MTEAVGGTGGERRGAIGEFFAGVGDLPRGLGLVLRRPALFWLGVIPPAITSALLITGVVLLAVHLELITGALTGWAPDDLRLVVRIAFGVVIMILAVLLAVIIFSSLTLLLGAPIYERISLAVEAGFGGVAGGEVAEPVLASGVRSVRQSLTLLGISLLLGIPVLLLGLIPGVGGVLGTIASTLVGARMITMELIGGPFDRRGRRDLAAKHAALRSRRARTLGFGVVVFVLFSLPLVSVLAFPAATAGATVLARRLVGEPVELPSR